MDLSTLDFILIGIYFAILLIIGYYTSRKQKPDDFLIADRKLGSWTTMATINASKTGSILMIFVALVYLYGFSAIWYFIGMIIGILLFIPFSMKLKENSEHRYYTLADYFKQNFGKNPAIFASLITIFLMVGFLVLNLIAGTQIFVFFTAWPFWLCAIIVVVIVLIYLLMGGFKAVAKTDILQYAAMIFILILLVWSLFTGSLIPSSEWNFFKADLTTMIGFFLVGILFPFAMPDLWQRVYASKNQKTLKRGMLLSAGIYALFAFLLALLSLTIKVRFPGIDADLALIHGFGNLLPAGLLGLAVVLLFAAIMSSIDTYLFTASSAVIQDFFKWGKIKTVKNLKRTLFIIAIIVTLIAILIQNLVLGAYLFVSFVLVLAVVVFSTWIFRKIKPLTLIMGFIIGTVSIIILLIYTLSYGNGITPIIAMVGFSSTIMGLIIGSLVSFIKKKAKN